MSGPGTVFAEQEQSVDSGHHQGGTFSGSNTERAVHGRSSTPMASGWRPLCPQVISTIPRTALLAATVREPIGSQQYAMTSNSLGVVLELSIASKSLIAYFARNGHIIGPIARNNQAQCPQAHESLLHPGKQFNPQDLRSARRRSQIPGHRGQSRHRRGDPRHQKGWCPTF